MEGAAGGNAAENALFPAHTPSGGVGFLGGDGDHLVHNRQVQNLRDEIGADALDAVGTADALGDQGGIRRFRADDAHSGILFP